MVNNFPSFFFIFLIYFYGSGESTGHLAVTWSGRGWAGTPRHSLGWVMALGWPFLETDALGD